MNKSKSEIKQEKTIKLKEDEKFLFTIANAIKSLRKNFSDDDDITVEYEKP